MNKINILTKVWQEIKCDFGILAHILGNIDVIFSLWKAWAAEQATLDEAFCALFVYWILLTKIVGLYVFIAHARNIKRMTLRTNILETKLIAIRFKVSFCYACVLARIVSLKSCNKLHKLFCLQWAWYCLFDNDWWMKEDKHKFFGLDQIIWKQTNRVEKHSMTTICKYLV